VVIHDRRTRARSGGQVKVSTDRGAADEHLKLFRCLLLGGGRTGSRDNFLDWKH